DGYMEDTVDHALDLGRVDEMRDAELARHTFPRRPLVPADDPLVADYPGALADVRPKAAQPKPDLASPSFDLGREEHRADAGGDAAADVADLVERRVAADLGQRDLGHHDVIGKRRRAHVVMDDLATHRKARRAVGHQALALRGAYGGA